MALETPTFQAYRGSEPPRFVNEAELEYAKILDYHGVPWLYEPHTFVLERADDGTVREAFTPDFFLPELGMYVECTVMRPALQNRKRRKVRKARGLGVNVQILGRHDLERLAVRWRLKRLEVAARTRARTAPRRPTHPARLP